MTEAKLLRDITDYYLGSRDFNGYPVRMVDIARPKLKSLLKSLVNNGDISLLFDNVVPNPYVKCLPPVSANKQIEFLEKVTDITHVVAYPEGEKLIKAVNVNKYRNKPYALTVAKGRPVLDCAFFKLEVLEKFRNDPRYSYRFNDVVGSIYAKTDMSDDEAYIKSVGIAYDDDMNRAVCVFYTDLMKMTVAQQRYWKHYELSGNYSRHPDFVRSQILGHFPENASLVEAFTEELHVINKLTLECFGKELFKHTYRGAKRPKELAFLIRPTSKELQNFIHLLDKLISENINKKFFKGKLQLETESERKDGRVQVIPKASLTLLEEFIRGWFRPKETGPLDDMFSTFKKIRQMRTSPAHSIEEDAFDMNFFKEQRELFIEAYIAIRLLRLALTNHPNADVSSVPNWLYEGKINSF
jgi:hypothetical protein